MKFSSRIDRIRSFASTYIYIERETWDGGQAGSFGHGTNKSTDLYLDVTVTAVTGKGQGSAAEGILGASAVDGYRRGQMYECVEPYGRWAH